MKLKLFLTLALSLVYLILYSVLEPRIGPSAGLLAVIPVVMAAGSYGMRIGAASGLLVAVWHGAFQYFTHDPAFSWISLFLTFVAASVTGAAVGRLRDQGQSLRRMDAELERRVEAQTAELSRLVGELRREIGERRQVETDLRTNQERFRALIENSNELIAILSAEGRIEYATPAAFRTLGYTPEAMPSWNAVDFIHPEDQPGFEADFRRVLQSPGSLQPVSLYRLRDSLGEWRVVEAVAVNLLDNPAVRGIVANGRDITERKRAEEKLRQSEQLYRTLIQNYPRGAIFLFDRGLRYTLAEGRGLADIGLPKESFIGKTVYEVFPPDTAARLAVQFRSALEGNTVIAEDDLAGLTYFYVVVPIRDEGGEITSGLIITQDITERKVAEAAVADQAAEVGKLYRASTQLLSSTNDETEICQRIAEAIVDEFALPHCTVWLVDEAGRLLRQVAEAGDDNIAFTALPLDGPGLTVAAVRSGEIVCVSDVTADPRYVRERSDTRSELVVPLKTGSRVMGVINLESPEFHAYTERHQRIVGAFAERAALALENTRLVVSLEEASRIKGQFLTNTSHELRTPLTSIIGSLDIVLNDISSSKEDERELVRMAFESAQGLTSIVDDLLEIAKIEAGDVELRTQVTAIGPILNEVYILNRPVAERKGLSLSIVQPDAPALVYADSDKLRRILLNIVRNAVKFTEEGSVTLTVHAEQTQARMVIQVQDTGIGVAPDVQPRLFQPFVQADGSTTRRYGGTGLGLTIARRLAEMMGGALTLHSAGEGQGTTMTLTLPLAESEQG